MKAILAGCAVALVLGPALAMGGDARGLVPAPGGLEQTGADGNGTAGFLKFEETDAALAMDIAVVAWGQPVDEGRMEECGAGPVDFARFENDLSLHFQEGILMGWTSSVGSGPSLASGVGIGSPLRELDAQYGPIELWEGSVGHEFIAQDLFGLVSGDGMDGEIEMIWSGVSCIFR